MSGAFPISNAKFGTLGIKSIQNTIISKTVSGKKLARQIDGQRFAFTVQIVTASRSDVYGELMAFIMKQRSGKENFTIIPPEIEDARGNETNTVLVNGSHAVGDTTIAMDGHHNDNPHAFKAGDFIKFASHSKVYMIVADVQASSNASTVTIEPPLIATVADDSVVTYDNVPFTVYLTNDIQEFGVSGVSNDGKLYYEYQFDVEEAL
nr:major capsid protein [uncultured Mediterranean phage uvMED]BAR38430.1 major capsid protein [uncultured Mediterranean phage uvMED]